MELVGRGLGGGGPGEAGARPTGTAHPQEATCFPKPGMHPGWMETRGWGCRPLGQRLLHTHLHASARLSPCPVHLPRRSLCLMRPPLSCQTRPSGSRMRPAASAPPAKHPSRSSAESTTAAAAGRWAGTIPAPRGATGPRASPCSDSARTRALGPQGLHGALSPPCCFRDENG